ncbi:hypothetical protein [Streptomyces sp. NPDC015350]|uniref:hypothetical protein n=1 Tax=Streptomyces sp. NPDC015350 TaxID=3364955 RepID=UPI0036F55850
MSSPVEACRRALDDREVTEGICTWTDTNYSENMEVHPRPRSTDVCGELNPTIGSVVNLTKETRLFYAFGKCRDENLQAEVAPGVEFNEFENPVSSWR